MSASPKQRKLIEDLQNEGAPIPAHPETDQPDFGMFDSVQAADAYIKQHYHLLRQKAYMEGMSRRMGPGDWGGNIPNH
jgi:hypothetical protein